MVDINKQVSYWMSSSDEEFEVAEKEARLWLKSLL